MRSVVLGGALLLSSCAFSNSVQAPGSYEVRKDGVHETLALNADGRYTLTSTVEGQPPHRHSGNWELSSVSGRCQRIIFENFTSQIADQGRPYVRAGEDWSTCIERSLLERTQIVIDADAGTYYVRQ